MRFLLSSTFIITDSYQYSSYCSILLLQFFFSKYNIVSDTYRYKLQNNYFTLNSNARGTDYDNQCPWNLIFISFSRYPTAISLLLSASSGYYSEHPSALVQIHHYSAAPSPLPHRNYIRLPSYVSAFCLKHFFYLCLPDDSKSSSCPPLLPGFFLLQDFRIQSFFLFPLNQKTVL